MRASALLPPAHSSDEHATSADHERPAANRARPPARSSTTGATATPRAALERSFAELPVSTGDDDYLDGDLLQAERSRVLIRQIAAQFGLPLDRIQIHADARAAGRTRHARAEGLTDRGIVFLDPAVINPSTFEGRRLLAHELAHVSQQKLSTGHVSNTTMRAAIAELEAESLASDFAATGVVAPVRVPLARERVAARSHAGTQANSLIATVRSSRADEIARIIDLLSYGPFDWAITDGDVAEVLQILAMAPMLTARAMAAAIGPKYRRRLFENLSGSAGHYDMRPEILAVGWSKEQGENWKGIEKKLLLPMSFEEVSDIEAVAIDFVVDHLSEGARKELLADSRRASRIKAIQDRASGEAGALAFAKELEDAQKEEKAGADARRVQDPTLGSLADDIHETLGHFIVRDRDALRLLDRIAAECLITRDPVFKFQALANAIRRRGGDKELDELIDQIPMSGLYRTEKRRKAFVYLASTRSPFKNEQLADKVLRAPWWKVWDWAITSEEAFLAFLLVKSMPSRARSAFFRAHDEDKWDDILLQLPLNILEADTFNLYTGGPDHKDEQSILAQLIDASLWTRERKDRLDAVIRMARAAGHGEFVFEQSKVRAAYERNKGLTDIVDKYELYDPAVNRYTYSEKPLEGHHWYQEGPFSLVGTLGAAIDFVFKSDNVDLATFTIGGEGLNLSELQDITEGSLVGARFRRPTAREKQQARNQRQLPANFANARWDTSRGRLDMQADDIELEHYSFPLEDLRISTGPSMMKGVTFSVRYDPKQRQLRSMELNVAQAMLHDLLFTLPESMLTVNHVHVRNLRVAFQAINQAELDPRRAGRRGGVAGWFQLLPNLWDLGLGKFWGIGHDPIKELAKSLKSIGSPRELIVTFDTAQLRGIARSRGEFIQQIEIVGGAMQLEGNAEGYRRALAGSVERIERRLNQERSQLHVAITGVMSLAEVSRRQKTVDRLQRMLDSVRQEMREGRPAGSIVDVGGVTITGAEGVSDKPIQLTDVHGQGRSVTGVMPLFTESTKLRNMLGGRDSLVTLSAAIGEEQGFSLDVGSVAAEDVRLAGGIPSADTAKKDLEAFVEENSTRHARPEFEATRAALEQRLKYARMYEEYAARGFQNLRSAETLMRPSETRMAAALRQWLLAFEDKRATVIGSVAAEGLALTVDALGRPGTRADTLIVQNIRTFTPDGSPDLTIGQIAGTGLEASAALEGGLSAAGDWRTALRRVDAKARSLSFKDVQKKGVGAIDELTIEGDENAPAEATLDRTAQGATTIGAKSRKIVARGLSMPVYAGLLRTELERLTELPVPRPDQLRRIGTIETMLRDLERIQSRMQTAEETLGAARTKAARESAAKKLASAKQALSDWERRLVVEKLTVEHLDVTISGLGDLLGENYDFESQGKNVSVSAGPGAKQWFQRAEVEGVRTRTEAGEQVVANRLVLGATGGTLARTETGYRLSGFSLAALRAQGVSYASSTVSVACAGETTLTGVEIDAEIARTADGQRLTISRLVVDRLFADRLRYEDRDKIVTVQWGDLQGIRIDGMTVLLPSDPTATTVDGSVSVDQFKSLVVDAAVSGHRLSASISSADPRAGAAPVRALTVHLARSGNLEVSLVGITASGTLTRPRVDPDIDPTTLKRIGPYRIDVQAKSLSGRFSLAGDSFTIQNLSIGELTVSNVDWRAGNKSIAIRDRVTLSGVSVDAEGSLQSKGRTGNDKELSRLVFTRFAVSDIDARNVSVTIDRVEGDPMKGVAASPRQTFDLERAHIAGLTLTGFDVLNTRGVVEVKKSIAVTNLRAVIGEAAAGQIVGGTFSVTAYGRDADAAGKGGNELSATLNGADGTIIRLGRIDQALVTDVRNTKEILPKRWADIGKVERASVEGVTTGDIIIKPDSVTVSTIEIASMALGRTSIGSTTPGSAITLASAVIPGKLTIWNIEARFKYVPPTATTKATHVLEEITVDDLSIDRIDVKGFDYVGPVGQPAPGGVKEAGLSLPQATLTGLFLDRLYYDFGRQLLSLDASLKSATVDQFAFELAESLGTGTRSSRLVANVQAKGLSVNAVFAPVDVGGGQKETKLTAGRWQIDSLGLHQIDARLRAPGEKDKKFGVASKHAGALGAGEQPGIEVHGLSQDIEGITVQSIQGRALVYQDPNIGLTLDIRAADLPEPLQIKNDGFIRMPSAEIKDAYFRVEDVTKLGGTGGAPGVATSPATPAQWISYLDVLDHLNGHVGANLYLPIQVTTHTALRQEMFPIRLDITNGKFDYAKTEDAALWSRNDLVASLSMDDGKLALSVFGKNLQTWTPSTDVERAEMDKGLVRLKRIALPDKVRQKLNDARMRAMGIPVEPGLEPGGPIDVLEDVTIGKLTDWLFEDAGPHVEQAELRNVDAQLRLAGRIPVDVPGGRIVLGSDTRDAMTGLVLASESPQRLTWSMQQLNASVEKLDIAGTGTAQVGEISIDNVRDASLEFLLGRVMYPRKLEGTITKATVRNLTLSPENKP